jgi:hypothetical protein
MRSIADKNSGIKESGLNLMLLDNVQNCPVDVQIPIDNLIDTRRQATHRIPRGVCYGLRQDKQHTIPDSSQTQAGNPI